MQYPKKLVFIADKRAALPPAVTARGRLQPLALSRSVFDCEGGMGIYIPGSDSGLLTAPHKASTIGCSRYRGVTCHSGPQKPTRRRTEWQGGDLIASRSATIGVLLLKMQIHTEVLFTVLL